MKWPAKWHVLERRVRFSFGADGFLLVELPAQELKRLACLDLGLLELHMDERKTEPRAGRDRQGHEFSDRYASQKLDDRRMRYPHQAFAGAGRVEAETLEERQFVVTGVADDLSGTDISSALLHLGVHRGADPRAL